MIGEIDRHACRLLKAKLQAALDLDNLGFKELGVDVQVGSARFSSSSATFKVEVSIVAADGTVETKTVSDFKRCAQLWGLQPDDFGRTFRSRGIAYEICGGKPGSYKYPILGKRVPDGKVFKFPADVVRDGIIQPSVGKG